MSTHTEAEARRDVGMARAVDHADRDVPGWSFDAQAALGRYCKAHGHGHQFLAEELRLYAETLAIVPTPPSQKAWGAVMQRAAREGLIRKVGYAPSASSNMSPKTLWGVV
jgi:hypothetical protein